MIFVEIEQEDGEVKLLRFYNIAYATQYLSDNKIEDYQLSDKPINHYDYEYTLEDGVAR